MPRKGKRLGPEGVPVFAGPPTTFENAYPDIDQIEIWIESDRKDFRTGEPERSYHFSDKLRIPAYVDCGNSLCHEGGFSIQEIVDSTYFKKITEKEGHIFCHGHEHMGSRWKTRDCFRGAKYKVKIRYKEAKETRT